MRKCNRTQKLTRAAMHQLQAAFTIWQVGDNARHHIVKFNRANGFRRLQGNFYLRAITITARHINRRCFFFLARHFAENQCEQQDGTANQYQPHRNHNKLQCAVTIGGSCHV